MSEAENFNWVAARNACSISAVFDKLMLDVKSDIDQRQELRERHEGLGHLESFTFASNGSKFSAIAQNPKSRHSIIFSLRENRLVVSNEHDKELFVATVTLNNDKRCMLVVAGEQMEAWQFRRLALETLFFGDL
jgi:hypothetical protein